MKKAVIILTIFGLFTGSCGQATKHNHKTPTDTIKTIITDTTLDKKEKERLEQRKKIEEQERIDSLMNAEVLNEALNIATQNINKKSFYTEYNRIIENGYYDVKVEISLAYHFTKNYPHLIIRRSSIADVYIDIFLKDNNSFEKVLSHKQWTMEYVNDTVQDINGDGLKDFVVDTYGVSGCCLKAFSIVYLLRPDRKTFSNEFEFINPTFSPKEKIIRGICYGQPGETEMYKYKWNGEKVDTLEYVYYEIIKREKKWEKTGKIIVSTNRPHEDNHKVLKRLNSVPNEYKKIEGYDWFLGFE